MALVWQPQEAAYLQICNLLSEYQKPGANQALVLQQLEQAKHVPDFNNYLSFIFSKGDNLPLEVRQSAGLLLKNNLKGQYTALSEDFRNYIKGDLLHVLSHPERVLRHTAGSISTTVVGALGLVGWPELVHWLVGSLGSGKAGDGHALDGALDSLSKVVEDHPHQLDVRLENTSWGPGPAVVSEMLVPPLMELLGAPSADTRRRSMSILNDMFGSMPTGFQQALHKYAEAVFKLATDQSSGVRREVCIAFCNLVSVHPELLQAHLPQLIEYMLVSNQDADEEVALEAAEFWLAFCESELGMELLQPVMSRLIPVLMHNMIFDEYDDEVSAAEEAEEQGQKPDQAKDIKPTHSKHTRARDAAAGDADDEDGGGGDDDEELRVWNLRKCSAAALDMLSNHLSDEHVLPLLLPIVQQRLADGDWKVRESAILALGAVSEGCHMGLAPYLQDMIKMLVPVLQDPRPMVRIITCWCLARYTQWVLLPPGGELTGQPGPVSPEAEALFDSILSGLLARVTDHNGRVQEAACSGLAEVLEHAGHCTHGQILVPRFKPITDALAAVLSVCGRRNLRIVLDAVTTAMDTVGRGHVQQQPAAVQQLMVVLGQRWQQPGLLEQDNVSIMEALTSLAVSLGPAFEPYAPAVFERTMQQLTAQQTALEAQAAGQPGAGYDEDVHMAALDLMAGLADGLRASIEPLVAGSPLPTLLLAACGDQSTDVRQSAFALLGDLAKACPSHVLPHLERFLALCLSCMEVPRLTEDNMPSANNAIWSMGEMIIRAPPASLVPHVVRICEASATPLMGSVRVSRSLQENAAITLGRTAMVCPDQVAPLLGHFATPWCNALRNIRDDLEKEQAFRGLLSVVQRSPESAVEAFTALAGAVCSWRFIADEQLRLGMVQMMRFLHDGMGAARWGEKMQVLDAALRAKLEEFCR